MKIIIDKTEEEHRLFAEKILQVLKVNANSVMCCNYELFMQTLNKKFKVYEFLFGKDHDELFDYYSNIDKAIVGLNNANNEMFKIIPNTLKAYEKHFVYDKFHFNMILVEAKKLSKFLENNSYLLNKDEIEKIIKIEEKLLVYCEDVKDRYNNL